MNACCCSFGRVKIRLRSRVKVRVCGGASPLQMMQAKAGWRVRYLVVGTVASL
jgi:precorrin-6B methylase 1